MQYTVLNEGVNFQRNNTGLTLKVEGQLVEVELEACIEKIEDFEFVKNPSVINGLQNFKVELRTHFDISQAKFVRYLYLIF